MLSAMLDQVKYVQEAIERITSSALPAVSTAKTNGKETLTETQEQVCRLCYALEIFLFIVLHYYN